MRATLSLLAATALLASAAHAAGSRVHAPAPSPSSPEASPGKGKGIPGGMSARLAGLSSAVRKDKKALVAELREILDESRSDAHRLIDDIVDKGELDTWLDAMGERSGSDLASKLRGKPPEQVKAALHSRLDRKISKLGKEITSRLDDATPERLQESFELALKDLSREEGNLASAASVALGDGADEGPAAPEGSPRAPAWAYMNPGGVRTYNAYGYGRTAAYNRTLAVAQQRAWFSGQLAARNWQARVNSFNTYLYGRRQPGYANPRFRRSAVPAGYYYRPDRVERVVRRGLWGAAAVAATPFALVASIF